MPRARQSSGTQVIYRQHWPADPVSPFQAQLIAQSIGQAFSVAYQEFLRANGINPEDLSQKEYSDLLNTQDMYNDDLIHFSKSENCKDASTSLNLFPRLGWLGLPTEEGKAGGWGGAWCSQDVAERSAPSLAPLMCGPGS